ncbi:MAG: hypothetical protein QM754_13145 [Tepidisphaeraceae bacterium]
MTPPPIILAYAQPAHPAWQLVLKTAAEWGLAIATLTIAGMTFLSVPSLVRADTMSYGGCANGRLRELELITFAIAPLATVVFAGITHRLFGIGCAWRVARISAVITCAAYATLWFYKLGVLHLIKYGSPFA